MRTLQQRMDNGFTKDQAQQIARKLAEDFAPKMSTVSDSAFGRNLREMRKRMGSGM